jgi:ubiquinone/menaquinone biosynthesis C-methylase UbiE
MNITNARIDSNDTNRVKDYWSTVDCSASEKNFYCFPPIRTHSCKLIFNETDATRRDWCEYWTVEKYLKNKIPFDTVLSICCGFGEVERTLSKLNAGKKIIGTDIAPGAIDTAKKRAYDENLDNIEYYVADLQNEQLPENTYDLIWANGALHHIKNLDYVIPMLYKSLKSRGYLISNEYVGPNYQQISQRHEELVNAIMHILPPEWKDEPYDLYKNAQSFPSKGYRFLKYLLSIKKRTNKFGRLWKKNPKSYFLRTDPSECVNSEMIIPLLENQFETVDVRYFNGSIVMFALGQAFYNNFDINNPAHYRLLDLIFQIEDTLVENGEIPNINAHIICQKR